MQPLVEPLSEEELGEELGEMVRFYGETLGFCPGSVMTMLRRPEIARAFIRLNMAVMENRGRVSSALKRMVAHVSSRTAGCAYCQAHSIMAAERYGAGGEKMANLSRYRTHPAFTEAERVALDFAEAASTVPNGVDEDLMGRLRAHWDEGELVELMGVIALFGYLNRWNDGMATRLEDPALAAGRRLLDEEGWTPGRHR